MLFNMHGHDAVLPGKLLSASHVFLQGEPGINILVHQFVFCKVALTTTTTSRSSTTVPKYLM